MVKYIKLVDNAVEEAPYMKIVEDKKILGYNRASNEEMLIADGYIKYEGNYQTSLLNIVDGEIVENIPETPAYEKTIYSKLEIRRALREAGKEEILDGILSAFPALYKDWNDAQDININDPAITEAITSGIISEELVTELKDLLK